MSKSAWQSVAGFVLLVVLAGGGCVTQDYLGDHYSPTDHVDVMYNVTGTPSGYKVMGQDRAEAGSGMSAEDIVKEIVKKGQEVGADAVIIKGMETVETGTQTNTNGNVDASGGQHSASADYSQNTQTTVQKDKLVTATFLKKI